MKVLELKKIRTTYSHNCSKNTKIRKGILNVLESISSSLKWAATMLPTWVLGAQSLSEVLRFADLIFTKIKINYFNIFC
jgi:hypothetical protein